MKEKLIALGNVRPRKVDWLASVRWAESEVLVGAKRPEEGKTKTMSKQTESHAASAPLLAGPVQPVPAACPSESFCTWPVLGAYAVTDVFENYVGGAMESPSWPYDCWEIAWSLAFTLCRISYLSRGAGCISSTSAKQATGRLQGHGPQRRWYLVHPAQLTQYTVTLTPATGKFITCECGCICQKQELRVSSPH